MCNGQRLKNSIQLLRLDKPVGTLLLLWPTLSGLWLAANGPPPLHILLIFITGVVVMRSAGCLINDMADYKLDAHVTRTRDRPLARGAMHLRAAWIMLVILMSCALALALQLNRPTLILAFIAAGITLIYPLLKRITHLPQAGLGLAFSAGIPMAFTAIRQHLPADAFWLFAPIFLWILMYDTLYAMADRNDDLRIGIRSSAILFGRQDRLATGILQACTVLLLIHTGRVFQLRGIWLPACTAIACCFLYQQWLIRDRQPASCLRAFANNNLVGMLLFAGILFQ